MSEEKKFYSSHSLTSTTYIYGRVGDQATGGSDAVGAGTTTVTSALNSFAPLIVGDIVHFSNPTTAAFTRKVTTAGAGSIVVDSSVTAGTYAWKFYPVRIGTTANDGWHNIDSWTTGQLFAATETGVAADIQLETRVGTSPVVLVPTTAVALSSTLKVTIPLPATFLRVGVKVAAGTGVVSVRALGDNRGR